MIIQVVMSLVSLVMAVHDPTPLEQRVSEDRYMSSVPQDTSMALDYVSRYCCTFLFQ